jgi:hypothetical protein
MHLTWPSTEQGLSLHRRLCAGEATAPSDFAVAYTDILGAWIQTKNPRADEDQCQDAAHRAILAFIHRPSCYDPARGETAAYLRMSAQGDLINLRRREDRHNRGRVRLKNVEDVVAGGKYLETTDDAAALSFDEEKARRDGAVLAAVRESLTASDQRCLDLMRQGEKQTAAFAAAAGFSDLAPNEQARAVKRVKDRIKKRIQRAGGGP